MVFIHICVFVFVFAANPWAWGGQHRLAWEADGGQAAAGWDGQQATGKKKSCKETGGDVGDEDDGDYDDDDDGDNDVGNYGGCVASDDGGAQQQNVAEVLLRDKCLVFLYITNVIKCGLNIVVDRQGHAENNVEQILFQMPPRTPSAQGHLAPAPSPLPVQRWKSFFKIIFLSWAFPWKSHLSSKSHLFLKHFRAKSTAQPASTKTVGRGAPRKQVIFLHQSAISDITEETPIHHFHRMLEEAVSTLKEQVNIYEQEVDQVN